MALEPITRQEKIIAGQDLTPITRMEMFLKQFGGGGGSGLPTGAKAYQQLVTDGEGNAKWEDRLVYSDGYSITWDGDTTGRECFSTPDAPMSYCKVSDIVLAKTDLIGATYFALGQEDVATADDVVEQNGAIMIGVSGMVMSFDSDAAVAWGVSPGTYFLKFSDTEYVSSLKKEQTKQIDPKFIPVMDGVVLNSSTSGSTKKFKITVDDSGTISATEV